MKIGRVMYMRNDKILPILMHHKVYTKHYKLIKSNLDNIPQTFILCIQIYLKVN